MIYSKFLHSRWNSKNFYLNSRLFCCGRGMQENFGTIKEEDNLAIMRVYSIML